MHKRSHALTGWYAYRVVRVLDDETATKNPSVLVTNTRFRSAI
jgi:hypothetical protein